MKLMELKKQQGTYIAATLTPESKQSIWELVKDINIPNKQSKSDYHTTLIYSRTPCDGYEEPADVCHAATVADTDIFQIGSTGSKQCLVLILDSPDLTKRHKSLMKQYDATYDYDEYHPHITLSYDIKDFDVTEFTKKVKDAQLKIEFNNEYSEPLNNN